MNRRNITSQIVLAALLVVVGTVLLAETTDAYDASILLQFVPSLSVLLGLYALVKSEFRNLLRPLVVAVAGAWQLIALDVLPAEEVTQLWPLLIVAVGRSIILGHYRSRSVAVTDAFVTSVGVFGGSEQRSTSTAFAGADLTALFGGVSVTD